jgi:uncharacterized membrane protein
VDVLAAVLTVLVLAAVIIVISAPLRTSRRGPRTNTADRAELEAAREAKYREIRDAELDYRTGKLSDDDYATVERTLRGEAMEILRRLDALAAPRSEPE